MRGEPGGHVAGQQGIEETAAAQRDRVDAAGDGGVCGPVGEGVGQRGVEERGRCGRVVVVGQDGEQCCRDRGCRREWRSARRAARPDRVPPQALRATSRPGLRTRRRDARPATKPPHRTSGRCWSSPGSAGHEPASSARRPRRDGCRIARRSRRRDRSHAGCRGDTPRFAGRAVATRERERTQVAEARGVRTVDAQQFAAPRRPVVAEPDAVERKSDHRSVMAMFRRHGRDVCVVMLDGMPRHAMRRGERDRVLRAEAIRMQIMHHGRGLDVEHLAQVFDRLDQRAAGCRRVEVADVRRHERLGAARQRRRCS